MHPSIRGSGTPVPLLDAGNHFFSVATLRGLRFKVKAQQDGSARPIEFFAKRRFCGFKKLSSNLDFIVIGPTGKGATFKLQLVFGIIERCEQVISLMESELIMPAKDVRCERLP
jgi:hypothetical protein